MAYKVSDLDIQFLSSLMKNPNGVSSLDKEVSESDFSDSLYYEIYLEIVKFVVQNKIPSYTDLKFKFKDDALLIEIINKMEEERLVVNDINIVYSELCEVSRKRRLKALGQTLYNDSDKTDSRELIAEIESKLINITLDSEASLSSITDIEHDFVSKLKYRAERYQAKGNLDDVIEYPTGIKTLDDYTLGLHKKNTWVIGGAISDGKTQLAVQICNSIMATGKKAFYFMLEDSDENLITRFAALRTSIPISRIRVGNVTNAEIGQIQESLGQLKSTESLFIDDSLTDVNDIVSKAKFAKLKHPDVGVIVVDHINCATDRSARVGNREQELSSVSKKLLSLSKSCDVPMLILQQLNTNPDEKGRGCCGQFLLHRPRA